MDDRLDTSCKEKKSVKTNAKTQGLSEHLGRNKDREKSRICLRGGEFKYDIFDTLLRTFVNVTMYPYPA
jgi:hypothetical protein